ncbi:MAG: hypothetical protein EOM40_11750 [Clostridia bacterium]|nr:hypothetical protein [Clostridia bacterium]NCC43699.1 hypothetical protein [Clostridia bacterium]
MRGEETIKIKINEMSRLSDITLINEIKPEYAGFTFSKNKNRVTLEQAEFLGRQLDPSIKTIGRFSNASLWLIAEALEQGVVDIAQIDDDMSIDDILQLRRMTDRPLIKKIIIKNKEDIRAAQSYPVDYFLYTFIPDNGKERKYLQTLLEYYQETDMPRRKFFLSEYIDHIETEKIIKDINPYGLNINISQLRKEKKGWEEIHKVINRLRNLI